MNKIIYLSSIFLIIVVFLDGIKGQRMFADPKLLQKVCGKNADISSLMSSAASCVGNVPDQVR